MAIPKIIHYCWVGNKPKPESVIYCISTWKKYCPDYEIIEWNESNYDFSKNFYMKEAYEAGKWGFVPDYARLDIVYQYGGIYLDTDVELLKSFDNLLDQEGFMGFENTGDGEWFVNCGHGFGAEPHNEIIKKCRDLYDNMSFKNADGTLNMIASPHFTTETLRYYGLKQINEDQNLPHMMVYASDVLCPKTFRTGKLKVTDRTVSIHHFTASWMDDQIKEEFNHQQKVIGKLGNKLGHFYLYAESVVDKYSPADIARKIPEKVKQSLIETRDQMPFYGELLKAKIVKSGNQEPVILNTSINSDNLGDDIIMENCSQQLLKTSLPALLYQVPTHSLPSETEKLLLRRASFKILCGTNILSGRMRSYGLWKMDQDVSLYKNTVLMGVGFDKDNSVPDAYTKQLFHTILSETYIHSVRDSNAEKQLKAIGIHNVINTACPTMWDLTEEHCKNIPQSKASEVVTTITDYKKDYYRDKRMLEILLDNYQTVYFWIQGSGDFAYLDRLQMTDKVQLIPATLAAYEQLLQNSTVDYVGTRLHSGIEALRYKHRSLIISIDNRAKCIAEDTDLPVLMREDIDGYLAEKIQSKWETKIRLPEENIRKWLGQF